ncbi:hypothetical protein [Burkholderia ubonensis]|uniref:hypothetical protein n=1 Tax=Burkholderia ubonensis TaxID=101571 RepID=UPI000A842BEB|nr:hypothetical protein [Burkholderia ubonensis]
MAEFLDCLHADDRRERRIANPSRFSWHRVLTFVTLHHPRRRLEEAFRRLKHRPDLEVVTGTELSASAGCTIGLCPTPKV